MAIHKMASANRLSDKELEELASQVEAGDVELVDWRRPGRPSLTGKPVESPVVQFRTTPEVITALKKRAATEGSSVSEIARKAVEQQL